MLPLVPASFSLPPSLDSHVPSQSDVRGQQVAHANHAGHDHHGEAQPGDGPQIIKQHKQRFQSDSVKSHKVKRHFYPRGATGRQTVCEWFGFFGVDDQVAVWVCEKLSATLGVKHLRGCFSHRESVFLLPAAVQSEVTSNIRLAELNWSHPCTPGSELEVIWGQQ